MTKEQKKNSIIGALVFLVVIGGLYYAQMNKKSDMPTGAENSLGESELGASDTESTENKDSKSDTALEPKAVDTDKAKLNSLLEAGSKAFHSKNYSAAIGFFNDALAIEDADFVYSRLHSVYSAMGDKVQALKMIDMAISKNQLFTEHWVTKLVYLDEKTNTSFAELKQIYTDGLGKVDSRTKPNLVTTFAQIAEKNGMKDEAIAAWQKAIELYSANKATYQAEIDRLKSS
ncbi:MAG: tetratricopeptide repeat protein [Candidatus Paceibacterota bacterium]